MEWVGDVVLKVLSLLCVLSQEYVQLQDSAKLDKKLDKYLVVIIDQLLPCLKYFFVFLLMSLH